MSRHGQVCRHASALVALQLADSAVRYVITSLNCEHAIHLLTSDR